MQRAVKPVTLLIIAVAACGGILVVEELRIAGLKRQLASVSQPSSPDAFRVKPEEGPPSAAAPIGRLTKAAKRSREPLPPSVPEAGKNDPEASIGKTIRKMWDNPAGKAMMNQGVKVAIAMQYEDFIESMDFTKDEAEHFKSLLAKQMSGQQELGMKMMSATPEEIEALSDELEKRKKEVDAEIETFLNSEQDFAAYENYTERLPERQQLDGIRAVMASQNAAMDEATEAKLVEAMHEARTNSSMPDMSGADSMKDLASGNLLESFDRNWDAQNEALIRSSSDFLSPAQVDALKQYQEQMKDMQRAGIEMAEKMMKGGGKPETE